MDVREKLVELLKSILPNFRNNMSYWGEKPIYEFADRLLAKGVTVQETARRCVDGKPVTNADRIRNMTDEELKKFICSMFKCEFCDFELGERCGLLIWLQQPAEEGE